MDSIPQRKPYMGRITFYCATCDISCTRRVSQCKGPGPYYCSGHCAQYKRPPQWDQTIREEYLAGATLETLASKHRCTTVTILNSLKRTNTPRRALGYTAWRNGHPWQGHKHTEATKQICREAQRKQFENQAVRDKFASRRRMQIANREIPAISQLEYAVAEELTQRGVKFTHQYAVIDQRDGHCIAALDFMLDDGRGIEVNGTYWHADPRKYPNGPIYGSQHKIAKIYRHKMKRLKELGIPIIELWEIDIKADLSSLLDSVL